MRPYVNYFDHLLWPPCVADADIIFLPCGFFFFLSIYLFSSPSLRRRRLDVYHTSRHCVVLMRIYDAGLKRAARGSLKIQAAKNSPSGHHRTTLSGYIFATKARITVSTIGKKNSLNSNISLTCPYNIVNFGPLAAEIPSGVWGTPANFNGFRVLAALLHGTLV